MPALNFMKVMAPKVESGEKNHTIRAKRKHPILSGDTLYLYTGMRTKSCRLLRPKTTCLYMREIKITESFVKIDGQSLYRESIKSLAIADGFESVEAFREYFKTTYGFPFYGDIIYWPKNNLSSFLEV